MKLILKNVAVYEMWSLVAAERNVQRQISKAMCTFQPPSTKRKSLDFRLEQKPQFLMKIGIVRGTAPSGLYAEDPEIKIARETAMFYATSNASLILTNGQTQVHIPWSAAQQPCDFFGSYCSPGATGQDRGAPQPGENRVTEEPQDWGCASDESQWAWGFIFPASLHGIWTSWALWPELSTLQHRHGPAGSKHQDHSCGCEELIHANTAYP